MSAPRAPECSTCGLPIRWAQRKDGSWYAAIPVRYDPEYPGRYSEKVARRPHSCGATPAQKADHRLTFLREQIEDGLGALADAGDAAVLSEAAGRIRARVEAYQDEAYDLLDALWGAL